VNASKTRRLAAWLGIWMMNLPGPLLAQALPGEPVPTAQVAPPSPAPSEPKRLQTPASKDLAADGKSLNQKVADTIADHLRQSQQLRHFQVAISFEGGLVELKGQVTDQSQHDEVLRIVHSVPGVERIRDSLVIRAVGSVTPVQSLGDKNEPVIGEPPVLQPGPIPKAIDTAPAKEGGTQEPTPIFQPVPPGAPHPAYQQPRMPPYAWPTYAPYNNFARVAYPSLYPYYSWPFIGPFYPFPKIPPGWRSIELTWQDGKWWYGKKAKSHDWWRVRYW